MARRPANQPKHANVDKPTVWVYGLHAVRQAWLNPSRQCQRLMVTENAREAFESTLHEAAQMDLKRPKPENADRDVIDRLVPGAVHQGIALLASSPDGTTLEDIIEAAEFQDTAMVMVLDQVTDPHNIGAILRSSAAFGALAVITLDRGTPPLTGVLAKTASGAVDAIPLVRVVNLTRAMEQLKQAGFWMIGFAESGRDVLGKVDLGKKVGLVLGAEGEGLRRLTMENCDLLVQLPTVPPIGSLNVSNAAAVALYEVARSRV